MTDSGLSLDQERALAIMPKVMSSFSIPCSIFIIYEVICDHRTRGTTAVQRALVGMSIVDILASSAWFMSTWAVPEGSFAFAVGNMTTCNFQGFLLQLAIGAPLYNSSLALFYLLMIKQRWTDDQLAKIERFVHGFIVCFTIGTSILLLCLEQYNHIGAVCWVIGSPSGCGHSSYQPSGVPCDRGDFAWAWGLALFYGPLWVCVIACCTSMTVLYLEVRKTHRRSMRYAVAIGIDHSQRRSGSDSNRVAIQAMLYSASFLITWMPSTLWSIAHWFNWSHYGLDIAAATAEPLQGFWNLMIFLKSRPKTVMKVRKALACLLPCIFSPPDDFDMNVSFGTGLSANRRSTTTNLSAGYSSRALGHGSLSGTKKPEHRNTASTEAWEELKPSLRELAQDATSTTGDGDRARDPKAISEGMAVANEVPPMPDMKQPTKPLQDSHESRSGTETIALDADDGGPDMEDMSTPAPHPQTQDAETTEKGNQSETDDADHQANKIFRVDSMPEPLSSASDVDTEFEDDVGRRAYCSNESLTRQDDAPENVPADELFSER